MPTESPEFRFFPVGELRIADPAEAGKMPTLSGYAAVFNVPSQPMGPPNMRFKEVIKPGAFATALAGGADVRALWDHGTESILGRTKSGTLRVWEDDKGLRFECALPDTVLGRDAATSIRRGDVDGMSFGFRKIKDEWTKAADGGNLRTLVEIVPFDVSPTAFPAYEGTGIDLRSYAAISYAAPSEARATVTINDNSIVWMCRDALRTARSLFDCCQYVADAVAAAGDLSDADKQAIDDFIDQLEDTCAKAEMVSGMCADACDDDPGEEDDAGMDDEATRSAIARARRLQLLSADAGEIRAGHMTHQPGAEVNKDGLAHARALIAEGRIGMGAWSYMAEDRKASKPEDFLATQPGAADDSAAHWKYPIVKSGKVWRRALAAVRTRASQQDAKDVYDAAGTLLELMDKKGGASKNAVA